MNSYRPFCGFRWQAAVIWVAAACAAQAAPAALLPKPQKMTVQSGSLPLAGLSIVLPTPVAEEDRFAAKTLSDWLSQAAGAPVPVLDRAGSGPSIRLMRSGAVDALPGTDDKPGPQSREAYQIKVTSQGAELRAASSAGLFYAAQTLRQLVPPAEGQNGIPAVEIEDWPSLAYRGLMMDTGHGALPTEQEIQRQLDFMARFKLNQYYFYAETNIELKGYPLVSYGARYSKDQIRRVVAYARERHIDVVPCLEFYGHLHDLFKLETYADLGVLRHGGEINPRNPKLQALMTDWLTQMSDLFPSPWFHAGLDEPWELERAGPQATGGVAPGTLFLDHLLFVTSTLKKLGKRPMYWADVSSGARLFTKYPELATKVPSDAIAVSWEYSDWKDFTPAIQPLVERKVPFMAGTGIWNWDDVSPNFQRTFGNIDGFVEQARKNGALGAVHTAWTDDAQAIYRSALPAFAYGGAAAWQAERVNRATFFDDYCRQQYPPAVRESVAKALQAMTEAEALFIEAIGGETMFRFWDDPLTATRLARLRKNRESIHRARLLAEQAQAELIEASSISDPTGTLRAMLLSARMLGYFGMRSLYAVEIEDQFVLAAKKNDRSDAQFYLGTQVAARNHGRLADLMDDITTLREEYRQAWLAENGSWRLGTALGRFDAEFERWRRLQARVWQALQEHRDGAPLPTLEQVRTTN